MTPEIVQGLEDTLSQEARDHKVNVYVLTVPSLPKNALSPFAKEVAAAWIKGRFGAVIVFDDGTGKVAIETSDVVSGRFYEFELTALLKSSMTFSKRPRHSRDGLQHTTKSVQSALHELKMRANREDRSSFLMRLGLSFVGLIALALGAFEYFRRRPSPRADGSATASGVPPTSV